MNRVKHFRPSPALIVATVALVLSLGGTSYAAIVLPAASVGTKQLKNNAVVGSKVKNSSLTLADIKQSSLSRLNRVAYGAASVSVSGSSSQTIATATLTVPAKGFVLVTGWVTAFNANGVYYVSVNDDTDNSQSTYIDGVTATGTYTTGGNSAVFPVTAGTKQFSVRVTSSNTDFSAHGTIVAQFIPYGSTGSSASLGVKLRPGKQELPR
jgi:hypothetical protein